MGFNSAFKGLSGHFSNKKLDELAVITSSKCSKCIGKTQIYCLWCPAVLNRIQTLRSKISS